MTTCSVWQCSTVRSAIISKITSMAAGADWTYALFKWMDEWYDWGKVVQFAFNVCFFSSILYLAVPMYCSKLAQYFKAECSVTAVSLSLLCSTPRDIEEVKMSGKIHRKQAVLTTP